MRYLFFILSVGCVDTGKETGENSEDSGVVALPTVSHNGVCHHYGEADSQGTAVLNCMESSGTSWTAENFRQACLSDWDALGTYMSVEQNCPRGWKAYCDFPTGDGMVGASWEGQDYAGRVFYYEGSKWADFASHCRGTLVEADQ